MGKLPVKERDIQASILAYLAVLKIPAFRRNTGGMLKPYTNRHGVQKNHLVRFSAKGQSDIWGVLPWNGKHFEIEVKRDGEKPTPDQQAWLERMKQANCIAIVATSVDDVKEMFR